MKRLVWLLLIVPAVAGLTAMKGCSASQSGMLEVTGQIQGEAVTAGSRVGGRAIEVRVDDGSTVKTGDVLVRLDADEAQAVLAAATAKVDGAEAMLKKLEDGATPEQLRQAEAAAKAAEEQYRMAEHGARAQEIRAARAGLDAAQSQRDTARADFERVNKLIKENVATARQFDQAKMALDTAEAQQRAAKEKHDLVVSGARDEEIAAAKAMSERATAVLDEVRKGPREEDRAAARAARDAAIADKQRAEVGLKEMTIVSPIDGVVESIDVHPGDLIKPGALIRIINPEDLKLTIYVSEAMLGKVRLGQKVQLTTDSHGPDRFEGEIIYIANEGEYTPRNLQTQEERVQQVFGVKLRLNSAGGKLRAGMTATVLLPIDGAA